MPVIFEYMGILLSFFSKEHTPIHVHALYGGVYGMRVEFEVHGKNIKVSYKKLKGLKEFPPAQVRDLTKLIDKYKQEIVNDWIDFAVKNVRLKRKVIRTKIK